jgi:hypothetical protein
MLRPFGLLPPKMFYFISHLDLSTLSVPDEGYFRNASYVLKYTSTFLILLRGEYNSSNTRRLFTSGCVYAFYAQPADVLFIEAVLLMSEAV